MNKKFWQDLKKQKKEEPILVLAPMADVTDFAFRKMLAKYGKPDVLWTEFVTADGLFLYKFSMSLFDIHVVCLSSEGTLYNQFLSKILSAVKLSDGWPTYSQGEKVVLFLWKEAEMTGLRTTVGLFQGKFTIEDGYVSNVINNEGLFDGVRVDLNKLTDKEKEMVQMKKGKVPEDLFLSFLRKSVEQEWFPEELGGE